MRSVLKTVLYVPGPPAKKKLENMTKQLKNHDKAFFLLMGGAWGQQA